MLEDILRHELDAILCRFLLKFQKRTVTNTNQIVERRMSDSRSYKLKARSDTLFTTFIDRCSICTLYWQAHKLR